MSIAKNDALYEEVKSCTSIKSLLEFFTTQEFQLVKELKGLGV